MCDKIIFFYLVTAGNYYYASKLNPGSATAWVPRHRFMGERKNGKGVAVFRQNRPFHLPPVYYDIVVYISIFDREKFHP